jgi:hypothetical protein
MIKNLLVAAVAVLFSIAANAAEMMSKDGKMTFEVSESGAVMMKDGTAVADGSYMLMDGTMLMVKGGMKQ